MLFGLHKSLDMLFAEGLENAFERHRLLADAVRRAVEAWSVDGVLELNVVEPDERANSVTTVITKDGRDPKPLLDYCERKCGVVIGIGIGALSRRALRIEIGRAHV